MANEDTLRWEKELKSSKRPDKLVKSMLSAVDAIGAAYDKEIEAYLGSSFVSVKKISAAEYNSFEKHLDSATTTALSVFDDTADDLLGQISDFAYDELISSGKTKKVPLPRTIRDSYVRTAKKYINGQVADIKPYAQKVVKQWIAGKGEIETLRTSLAGLLERSKGYSATVFRSEIQNAYVSLLKDAVTNLGITKITRVVSATACELCIELEGEHNADDESAFEVPHPNCACTFHPVTSEASMSKNYKLVEMGNLSHGAMRQLVQSALNAEQKNKKNWYIYIREMYDDTVIYEHETSDTTGNYKSTTYQRSYSIDSVTNQVTLGEAQEVIPVLTYEPVISMAHFPLTRAQATFGKDTVTRTGKIFQAGRYEDKEFEITGEELQEVVSGFSPVPLDIEHIPTIFDDKIGTLQDIELDTDGVSLLGSVEIPKWLDDVIGKTALRVSTTWDRLQKKIVGLALVLDPRVEDAAVFSAYVAFKGAKHSKDDLADFQAIHDVLVERHGVVCATASDNTEEQDMPPETQNTRSATQTQANHQQQASSFANLPADVQQMLTSLRQDNDRLQRENIETRAASFADGVISDSRALPAERQSIIDDYTQAALDDRSSPAEVSFSKGGERVTGTRLDALRARYEARPKHAITNRGEGGGDAAAVVLLNETGTTEADKKPEDKAQRLNRLRSLTPLGRSTMKNGNGTGAK